MDLCMSCIYYKMFRAYCFSPRITRVFLKSQQEGSKSQKRAELAAKLLPRYLALVSCYSQGSYRMIITLTTHSQVVERHLRWQQGRSWPEDKMNRWKYWNLTLDSRNKDLFLTRKIPLTLQLYDLTSYGLSLCYNCPYPPPGITALVPPFCIPFTLICLILLGPSSPLWHAA